MAGPLDKLVVGRVQTVITVEPLGGLGSAAFLSTRTPPKMKPPAPIMLPVYASNRRSGPSLTTASRPPTTPMPPAPTNLTPPGSVNRSGV